jgi:hypothetical protein
MEHYDKNKSPLLVQAAAGAAPLVGVMALGQYYCRLLDGWGGLSRGRGCSWESLALKAI